jgi:hypothetical protein
MSRRKLSSVGEADASLYRLFLDGCAYLATISPKVAVAPRLAVVRLHHVTT